MRIDAIKRRGDEIVKALSILKKSHGLALSQVWIPRTVKNEDEEDWVYKMGGFGVAPFKDYYRSCLKIQNGLGRLALKTLETYQTYFSKNIFNLGGELQSLIPATTSFESSCCLLAICLSHIETGEFDYAFEFIFKSYDNNPSVFLESFFSKLETCLPNFKFSSGAQFGRELTVLDVDNPTESFNIFAMKKQEGDIECEGRLSRRAINIKFGNSIHRAAAEIKEALSFLLTDSHGLITLCQAWFYPGYINNDKSAVKFDGFCADAAFKDYYDACVKIQHGAGGLAVNTLVTYQPYLSRNIIINGVLQKSTCCFSVCLRNVYTGEFDYVFEFLFKLQHDNDPFVLLESLLITLETRLPSFKLTHGGARLGRNLLVVDADNLATIFEFLAFIKQHQDDDDCKEDETTIHTYKNGASIHAMDVTDSMRFADLETKMYLRFNLVSKSYKLIFLVKGGSTGRLWIPIEGDEDFEKLIGYCTRNRITRLVIRVLPCIHHK